MPYTVGMLGCGTIGTELVSAIEEEKAGTASVVSLYDRNDQKAERLANSIEQTDDVTVVDDPMSLADGADLVVEAAGQTAVGQIAASVLKADTDLMVMSVGAFADESLRETVFAATQESDGRLYVPSGAFAGLDGVKAASVEEIDDVELTTRKPPSGLEGAPYVESNSIDLDSIRERETIFDGNAADAASAFPSNINVALALSLAARVNPREVTVRVVVEPDGENNVHQVRVRGGAGEIETTVENVPSPTNPKTSYLAVLSAIEKLRSLSTPVDVGT